jgi:large subunit ribosomal protein L24
MAKIKKDDTVLVIAGKSKGVTGKVIDVDKNRILVEGVNRVLRHTKESTTERGVKVGGIVDDEGKGTRIGVRKDDEGKNVRISRRTGKDI